MGTLESQAMKANRVTSQLDSLTLDSEWCRSRHLHYRLTLLLPVTPWKFATGESLLAPFALLALLASLSSPLLASPVEFL